MKEKDRLHQSIVDILIVSILAVNSYTLERVLGHISSFKMQGLLDFRSVSEMDVGTIAVKLTKSGYNRGLLNGMMAERIKDLMTAISEGYLDKLPELVLKKDKAAALLLLCSLRGMGPTTAKNAWRLLTAK